MSSIRHGSRKIINLSELDQKWNWLSDHDFDPSLQWIHSSAQYPIVPSWLPGSVHIRRAAAAYRAARLLDENDVLVSHGPRMTMYGALAARRRRHLAFAFNFTDLPEGRKRSTMARAFKNVDRFVCFSSMEKSLYARHFDIDANKIDMLFWAAQSPTIDSNTKALIPGEYLCAVGSQGRDYKSLFEAMKKLPDLKLVLVATPNSIAGLNVPENVEVRCNIPSIEAMNILRFSKIHVLPLRNRQIPCGHVTLVAGMQYERPTIVTDSLGVRDYISADKNCMAVDSENTTAFAENIRHLWDDQAMRENLAASAAHFARLNCSPAAWVNYFDAYLKQSS